MQARLAPTAERLGRAEDPYIRYALKALTDIVVETLGQLLADVRLCLAWDWEHVAKPVSALSSCSSGQALGEPRRQACTTRRPLHRASHIAFAVRFSMSK